MGFIRARERLCKRRKTKKRGIGTFTHIFFNLALFWPFLGCVPGVAGPPWSCPGIPLNLRYFPAKPVTAHRWRLFCSLRPGSGR